ncbi:hypothetical protein IWW50_003137, partial [Coemansia erecta]
LCHICHMSLADMQTLVEQRLGLCLKKHSEDQTSWKLDGKDETPRTHVEVSGLGKLIASFPRVLHWQPAAGDDAEEYTLDSEQQATVQKLARVAFAAAPEATRIDASCTDDLLDPMGAVSVFHMAVGRQAESMVQVESVRSEWAAEVDRLRVRAAQKVGQVSSTPGRRSTRVTPAREPGFYDIRINGSAADSPLPRKVGARGRRVPKGVTGSDADAELPNPKRAKKSSAAIQDEITASNEIIRVHAANNRPDASHLVRIRDYVPLILPTTPEEPSHAIVEPRVIKHLKKNRHQTQEMHEYAISGFPAPVDPERWLAQQRLKYVDWLQQAAGCTSVMMENDLQERVCISSAPYGSPMCRGCITRQTDTHCMFKNVRLVTRLHAVLNNGEEFTRYLLVPMFTSEPQAAKYKLVVAPLAIPAPLSVSAPLSNDNDDESSSGSFYEDEEKIRVAKAADWPTFYNMLMTARTLQPALEMISRVLGPSDEEPIYVGDSPLYGVHPELGCSTAPCVYRALSPGSRQVCDTCHTSILSTYYSCAMCAQEVCPRCFAEWDDSSTDVRVIDPSGISGGAAAAYSFDSCKRIARIGKPKAAALHKRQQFIRISQFVRNDMERVREKISKVLEFEHMSATIDCGGVLSRDDLDAFHTKIQRICQRTRRTYAHEPWELPVVYVEADELTTAEFSRLWRRGVVVVVRGLLQTLDSTLWKPDWWISNFGYEMVNVLDCNRKAEPVGEWPLRDFYRLFNGEDSYAHMFDESMEAASGWGEHKERVKDSILKLKDWPPAEDFQTRLPNHFARFMEALPFPEYTQRAGAYNLANQLPPEFVPPDLGPKMYCAYGSSDGEGGVGTTNLHCDMADAVNIMAYAAPQYLRAHGIEVPGIWTREEDEGGDAMAIDEQPDKPPTGAAVWDIYPPEAIENLREYIRELKKTDDNKGDPIHDQATFLTYPMRKAIYERYGSAGGSCYRIYQKPGDAVFVPAGCAHQVCNYASAVKIAMDFVSPERVEYCRRLTGEFRKLDSQHPRNRDLLQLNSILWWTFAGQQKQTRKTTRKKK